jgi:hypothetical protein
MSNLTGEILCEGLEVCVLSAAAFEIWWAARHMEMNRTWPSAQSVHKRISLLIDLTMQALPLGERNGAENALL